MAEELEEEICMEQPEGFSYKVTPDRIHKVHSEALPTSDTLQTHSLPPTTYKGQAPMY